MSKSVNVRFLLMMALLCVTVPSAYAFELDSVPAHSRTVSRVGVDMRYGWVPPTNSYIRGGNHLNRTIIANAAAHLRYDFSFTDATAFGRVYPGTYQGVGVGANTFFQSSLLGTPVAVYVFQGAPVFRFSSRLWLGYEWNFGASFGWKKYDETDNDQNMVIGSSANAYINVSFLINYRLSGRWRLWCGVDGSHYSNGNTSWPNAGGNTIGARIGISYALGNESASCGRVAPSATELMEYESPLWSYDLMAYGAARKRVVSCGGDPSLVPGNFGVAGIQFAPMRRFNRFFRAGVSADIQYDESSNLSSHWVNGTYDDDIKFYRPGFIKQVSVGLSARAELNMPIFSVNVGFGRNLIGPADSRKFYQLLALKTFVTRHLFLHTGYQLSNFKDPNNLMIGVGYRFQ